jgi:hypothetical protein
MDMAHGHWRLTTTDMMVCWENRAWKGLTWIWTKTPDFPFPLQMLNCSNGNWSSMGRMFMLAQLAMSHPRHWPNALSNPPMAPYLMPVAVMVPPQSNPAAIHSIGHLHYLVHFFFCWPRHLSFSNPKLTFLKYFAQNCKEQTQKNHRRFLNFHSHHSFLYNKISCFYSYSHIPSSSPSPSQQFNKFLHLTLPSSSPYFVQLAQLIFPLSLPVFFMPNSN